ncbi:Uncharacterized protein dnm_028180 [Desulfonema magnum]|uniref:Uncharacterized protein n=1 Tax=Desulfonema magnum TaxID=45655 RepID=A0A975BJD0_9BACT|nr:Uncharacterized protein dnm_028180 [Desulfonema magnum]
MIQVSGITFSREHLITWGLISVPEGYPKKSPAIYCRNEYLRCLQ